MGTEGLLSREVPAQLCLSSHRKYPADHPVSDADLVVGFLHLQARGPTHVGSSFLGHGLRDKSRIWMVYAAPSFLSWAHSTRLVATPQKPLETLQNSAGGSAGHVTAHSSQGRPLPHTPKPTSKGQGRQRPPSGPSDSH